ncbi:MAG: tetratricopeptide repeat protein [Bacteroidia bacterium]|nr:tetratricopeptide repeat protein [Bacteroidia bacterium]MDW8346278.1 tetratricopeptide repeat protein [Bacteroidia bacterium]
MKNLIIILWACIWLTALAQQSQEQQKSKRKQSKEKTENRKLSNEERNKLNYYFIEGATYWANNQYAQALTYFTEVLKIDPNNAAANYNIAQIMLVMAMYEKGIPYAQKAIKLDKENIWYRIILTNLYLENKQLKQAIEAQENIVADFPNYLEGYNQLLNFYLQAKMYEKAITLCNDIEKKFALGDEIIFRKIKIYKLMGKTKDAVHEIKRLVELRPSKIEYKELLAETYKEIGMNEKCYEVLQDILLQDPTNGYALIATMQYYEDKGEHNKVDEYTHKLFQNSDLPVETKIQLLSNNLLKNRNKPQTLMRFLDYALTLETSNPENTSLITLIGDFYSVLDSLQKARLYYKKSLQINENNIRVWQALVDVSMRTKNYTFVKEDTDSALEIFPNDPDFIFCNGIACYNLKKYESGIKVLEKGVKISKNIPERMIDMYSMLGDMYNATKQYQKSDEAYEEVLKLDPKNTIVLNNYAYYLSLRKEKLDKAADMAKKAVELQPTPNNMDTYGWVLYKQGKYEDAEIWLKKAVDTGRVSSVVYEHYGDVLSKLNRKNEAVKYWRIALEKGGSQTITKKIETGLTD